MDVELEQVSGQLGTALLDNDGKIIKSTGELATEDAKAHCLAVYRMLQDTAKVLEGEPMKRISISFSDFSFVATLSERNIYIVKVQS